jgi:hypothetical protein
MLLTPDQVELPHRDVPQTGADEGAGMGVGAFPGVVSPLNLTDKAIENLDFEMMFGRTIVTCLLYPGVSK